VLEEIIERQISDREVRDYLRRHGIFQAMIAGDLGIKDETSREPCYAMIRPETSMVSEALVLLLKTLKDVHDHYASRGQGKNFDTARNVYGLGIGSLRAIRLLERAEIFFDKGKDLRPASSCSINSIDFVTTGNVSAFDVSVLYRCIGKNFVEQVFKGKNHILERGLAYFSELATAVEDEFGKDPSRNPFFRERLCIKEDYFVGISWSKREIPAPKEDWSRNVGNDEAHDEIRRIMKTLACYDPLRMRNVLVPEGAKPISILLEGRPGTGKTDVIRLSYATLSRYARQKGVPVNLTIIDSSFKDAYYSRSQHNLQVRLEEARDPSGIGLVVIDDVDAVIAQRSNRNSNEADDGILHVLLQSLDSMTTDYHGNYAIILASNYPEKIDIALKNRVTRTLTLPGPRSSEDIERVLFFGDLHEYQDHVDVSKEERVRISKLCADMFSSDLTISYEGREVSLEEIKEKTGILDVSFSGRDYAKIAEAIRYRLIDIAGLPDETLAYPLEKQEAEIKKRTGTANASWFEEAIKDRAEALLRREIEHFYEDVKLYARHLHVEREARVEC